MEVILKIPSAQSTFNATNNILDIVLPGNSGVYDLSQMYVVIDTQRLLQLILFMLTRLAQLKCWCEVAV